MADDKRFAGHGPEHRIPMSTSSGRPPRKATKAAKSVDRAAKIGKAYGMGNKTAERVVVTQVTTTTTDKASKRSRSDKEEIASVALELLTDLDKRGPLPDGI